MNYLAIAWEFVKIAIIPLAIWYFEEQVKKRDDRRKKEYAERKRELDEAQRKNTEMQFLMMERIDNVADMTHLMAQKLHEAGTINGDLDALDEKYKELNSEYSKTLKSLALEVLNK